MSRFLTWAAMVAAIGLPLPTRAAVIVNEIVYDDGGTDDREYVEIYNSGSLDVDISGWVLTGRGLTTVNSSATVPAATILPAGGFYVFGNTGVLNVNQVIAEGFLENDNESVELYDAGNDLQDAIVYESNKGVGGNIGAQPGVPAQIGPGIWGNYQSVDLDAAPETLSSGGLGRYVDGRDTDNNGRDFGFRPNTPGTSNNPVNITEYVVPDVNSSTVGSDVPGFAYSFVPPRVIDPSVADANNPNAIPEPPGPATNAIIAWDPSGGGNAVSTAETFDTPQSKFDIFAYLDTRDLPQMVNAADPPVTFRGSEVTVYGIGGVEALNNLTDISGAVGVSDSANGTTGVAWVYEKVGETSPGAGDVSENLYLVDAGDGGDSGQGGSLPFDWTVLATVDLSGTASDWFRLGMEIDAAGNGIAWFGNQTFNFVTEQHSGAFGVAYRENTQLGSDGTPDAILRPPTFAMVPEPASLALAGLALVGWIGLARRN